MNVVDACGAPTYPDGDDFTGFDSDPFFGLESEPCTLSRGHSGRHESFDVTWDDDSGFVEFHRRGRGWPATGGAAPRD